MTYIPFDQGLKDVLNAAFKLAQAEGAAEVSVAHILQAVAEKVSDG